MPNTTITHTGEAGIGTQQKDTTFEGYCQTHTHTHTMGRNAKHRQDTAFEGTQYC